MWFDIYLNAMLIWGLPFCIITCVLNLEHAQDKWWTPKLWMPQQMQYIFRCTPLIHNQTWKMICNNINYLQTFFAHKFWKKKNTPFLFFYKFNDPLFPEQFTLNLRLLSEAWICCSSQNKVHSSEECGNIDYDGETDLNPQPSSSSSSSSYFYFYYYYYYYLHQTHFHHSLQYWNKEPDTYNTDQSCRN